MVALLLVIVAPLLPAAWDYFAPSVVIVDNQSQIEISDIQVKMVGQTIWNGNLMPGASHEVWARPHGDGVVEISFSANGRAQSKSLSYVTGGIRERHEIVIESSLDIKYTPSAYRHVTTYR